VAEHQPSDLDDLLGISAPESDAMPASSTEAPRTYLTRRELREAEARAASPIPAAPASVVSAAPASVAVRPPRAIVRAEKALARASRPKARPAASQTHGQRKNPLSVLATMGVVGGLFAVAGLPAYAFTDAETISAAVSNEGAQSITVSAGAAATITARDTFKATTPEQLAQQSKDALRAAANSAYVASGAREMGDDYPWPYELTDDQGGGLSPLNYYYRECVDFVAWRLNRDAGYYAPPFKWVWSNLTPLGGNGGQWMYNWQAKGWPVSKTPVVGAVAYTGGNHIAYVKSVNGDGTVTIEEYNYIPGLYGQRTLPASSVVAFLYPPPA
jgi:surface antigen